MLPSYSPALSSLICRPCPLEREDCAFGMQMRRSQKVTVKGCGCFKRDPKLGRPLGYLIFSLMALIRDPRY